MEKSIADKFSKVKRKTTNAKVDKTKNKRVNVVEELNESISEQKTE